MLEDEPNDASRKLKSCFGFGARLVTGAAGGSSGCSVITESDGFTVASEAVAEDVVSIAEVEVVLVDIVGSNVPGKHAANTKVGCRDSAWLLASVFVFVSLISCEHCVHLIMTVGGLTRLGSLPCSSPIPASLFSF